MESNRKITEVEIADLIPAGSKLYAEIGGSFMRVPLELVGGSGGGSCDGAIFVKASAPDELNIYSYRIDDERLTMEDGTSFFCLFPDDNAPTRTTVKLSINGMSYKIYWHGGELSGMARTLGHALTRSAGFVHFVYTDGQLQLTGVDSISTTTRCYYSPSDYVNTTWIQE